MNLKTSSKNLYYVGGCVRDEILGVDSLDIDVCYEGDAVEFVQREGFDIVKIQKDIRTARVVIDNEEVDFASTRKEVYPKQGHLPVTTEIGCSLKDDLVRRDFTVNSIAKSVSTGEIYDPTGGLEDINNKLLRVHHSESFKDDPTRIIRALKFAVRFGFELEPETLQLQKAYLENVNYDMSYSRLKKELVDAFSLNKNEVLQRFIYTKATRLLSPRDYQLPKCDIAALINEFKASVPWLVYIGWMDLSRLDLTKKEKKIIEDYKILKALPLDIKDVELYTHCKKCDVTSVLLWIIDGGSSLGLKYLRELSGIELEIKGKDLLELGFSGKQIGVILESVLEYKLQSPHIKKSEELEVAQGHQDT